MTAHLQGYMVAPCAIPAHVSAVGLEAAFHIGRIHVRVLAQMLNSCVTQLAIVDGTPVQLVRQRSELHTSRTQRFELLGIEAMLSGLRPLPSCLCLEGRSMSQLHSYI